MPSARKSSVICRANLVRGITCRPATPGRLRDCSGPIHMKTSLVRSHKHEHPARCPHIPYLPYQVCIPLANCRGVPFAVPLFRLWEALQQGLGLRQAAHIAEPQPEVQVADGGDDGQAQHNLPEHTRQSKQGEGIRVLRDFASETKVCYRAHTAINPMWTCVGFERSNAP